MAGEKSRRGSTSYFHVRQEFSTGQHQPMSDYEDILWKPHNRGSHTGPQKIAEEIIYCFKHHNSYIKTMINPDGRKYQEISAVNCITQSNL